ncbi:hypothetical protein [Nonomuraea typhae]|uniref:Uncharacterized protein n=1 Tax=Nonomuraea typhae TaxID=2603600 RepID=A0ABW7YZT7_9ACTN
MPDLDSLLNHGFRSPYPRGSEVRPKAPGGAGNEAGMDRDRVRRLADDLAEQGVPPIGRAMQKLVGMQTLEVMPTAYTLSLFLAYTEAEGYLVQRVRRRVARLGEAVVKLHEGKETWKAAEDASTVSPGPRYA